MVSTAIAKGNVQAINYFVANNYMKALEALAKSPNQKVMMMPLEASVDHRLARRHRADRWRGVRRRLRQRGAAADRRQATTRQRSNRVE